MLDDGADLHRAAGLTGPITLIARTIAGARELSPGGPIYIPPANQNISGVWWSVKYSPRLEVQGGGDSPLSPDDPAYPTKALAKFLKLLQARDNPALIDLGPVVGSNVTFFGEQLGCRIRVEDLAADIERHVKDAVDGWLAGWDENGAEWAHWVERAEAAGGQQHNPEQLLTRATLDTDLQGALRGGDLDGVDAAGALHRHARVLLAAERAALKKAVQYFEERSYQIIGVRDRPKAAVVPFDDLSEGERRVVVTGGAFLGLLLEQDGVEVVEVLGSVISHARGGVRGGRPQKVKRRRTSVAWPDCDGVTCAPRRPRSPPAARAPKWLCRLLSTQAPQVHIQKNHR